VDGMCIKNDVLSAGHEKIPAADGCPGAVQGECLMPCGLGSCYWCEI
jgi:hypothetical protein